AERRGAKGSRPLVQAGWGIVVTAKKADFRINDLIHADAISIQRGRIRIGSIELRPASAKFSAVSNRICVQEWLHWGWGMLPRRTVRNDALLGEWLAHPQTLVGKKEKRLVLDDGAAEDPAEIILLLVGFCQMVRVGEPVVSVQGAIPEVFE